MSVKAIRATIECETCGLEFSVAIDESRHCPMDWAMYDMAVDAVRGGLEYQQKAAFEPGRPTPITSSVQESKLLCAQCTADADSAGD